MGSLWILIILLIVIIVIACLLYKLTHKWRVDGGDGETLADIKAKIDELEKKQPDLTDERAVLLHKKELVGLRIRYAEQRTIDINKEITKLNKIIERQRMTEEDDDWGDDKTPTPTSAPTPTYSRQEINEFGRKLVVDMGIADGEKISVPHDVSATVVSEQPADKKNRPEQLKINELIAERDGTLTTAGLKNVISSLRIEKQQIEAKLISAKEPEIPTADPDDSLKKAIFARRAAMFVETETEKGKKDAEEDTSEEEPTSKTAPAEEDASEEEPISKTTPEEAPKKKEDDKTQEYIEHIRDLDKIIDALAKNYNRITIPENKSDKIDSDAIAMLAKAQRDGITITQSMRDTYANIHNNRLLNDRHHDDATSQLRAYGKNIISLTDIRNRIASVVAEIHRLQNSGGSPKQFRDQHDIINNIDSTADIELNTNAITKHINNIDTINADSNRLMLILTDELSTSTPVHIPDTPVHAPATPVHIPATPVHVPVHAPATPVHVPVHAPATPIFVVAEYDDEDMSKMYNTLMIRANVAAHKMSMIDIIMKFIGAKAREGATMADKIKTIHKTLDGQKVKKFNGQSNWRRICNRVEAWAKTAGQTRQLIEAVKLTVPGV